MDWQRYTYHGRDYWTALVETSDAYAMAFHNLWIKVACDVLPQHAKDDWDSIKVSFWPDSGRIIVLPGMKDSILRTERAGCQLVLTPFLEFWEHIADIYVPNTNVLPSKDLDCLVLEEENRLVNGLLEAFRIVVKDQRYAPLWSAPVPFLFYESDNPDPFQTYTLYR